MFKLISMNNVIGAGLKANLHFINPCNAHCKGCFATSFVGETKLMSIDKIKTVVLNLGNSGVTYFNIAGGEPTLHPKLHETLKFISECGFKASLITNGFKLTQRFIDDNASYLDTIGISVDSFDTNTSFKLGRYTGSKLNPKFFGFDELKKIDFLLRGTGVKLKVNTVISKLNCSEKMTDKMTELDVCRWKIIKMTPYQDQFHSNLDLIPSDEEYEHFIVSNPFPNQVLEKDMSNAYLVVDPDGNLIDNRMSGTACKNPYRSFGNFLTESASEVLKRFLPAFNVEAYRNRYVQA